MLWKDKVLKIKESIFKRGRRKRIGNKGAPINSFSRVHVGLLETIKASGHAQDKVRKSFSGQGCREG